MKIVINAIERGTNNRIILSGDVETTTKGNNDLPVYETIIIEIPKQLLYHLGILSESRFK